jgi:hypothetical protein
MEFGEQGRQANGRRGFHEPIASGPFGSPSSRAASSASRDNAAIRCA